MNFAEFLTLLRKDIEANKKVQWMETKDSSGRPFIRILVDIPGQKLPKGTLADISYSENGYGKASRALILYGGANGKFTCAGSKQMATHLLSRLSDYGKFPSAQRYMVGK